MKTMKTALVTGGNSGIGYATAKLLKDKGYDVTISGRDAARLSKAAAELGVHSVLADMASPEDIKRLASGFLESGLDVLVNNAAIPKNFPVLELTSEEFSDAFNTNVRGPFLLIKDLLPALEKKKGCITSVGSVTVIKGSPRMSLYAATKGALDAITRNLAVELAPRNIRVNVVSPGPVETPMFVKAGMTSEAVELFKASLPSRIPAGRLSQPDEIAHVIVAQLESTYVTGAIWAVDGGCGVA